MSTRKILNIVAAGLFGFLLINLFIPFLSETSYWELHEGQNPLRVIVLLEFIIGAVICLLQVFGALKDSKASFACLGYYLTFILGYFFLMIDQDKMDYAEIGFWLGLLVSIGLLVVLIIAIFASDEKKERPYYPNNGGGQMMGYDPNTGAPIYAQPMGYDPRTGQPIYK